ncbi:MAG: TolC family protein [Ginsengibacter sp.]
MSNKDNKFKPFIGSRIVDCLLIIAMLFSALCATAQEKRTITLKEAIDLAIKNSHALQAGKARINEAAAVVKQAQQNRLPTVGVSGSYLHLNNANVDLKTKSNNSSGGTTENTSPKISQAAYGILNASYSIFNGGRLRYGIESALYLQQATVLDVDNNRQAVILNAIYAFTNLYKAGSSADLVKESLASSHHRDSTFIRLEQNGLLARNDLLKAQLETSDIELSLLDAENNRNLANVNMNLMLGLPETTQLVPDFNSIPQPGSIQNLEDYQTTAFKNRKDIQALELRKKAANVNIKSARTEGYPTINLTAGYIAAYVPHVITITNAINAGISIQYNLASLWKTNTRLLQANAQQQQLLANEAELNDAIRLQVNQDYQNYFLAQKKIDVYQVAVNQATENFRITKNKYNNNLVTLTDLLDADVALLRTKLNLSSAKADAVSAYNKLLQTAGQLSE